MSVKGNQELLAKFGMKFDGTKFYVYRITNTVNGKKYYGKTDDPDERWKEHKKATTKEDKEYVLYRAMRKYGIDSFVFSIVEQCETEQISLQREIYYIAKDKTNMCRYGQHAGYNMTDGGEGCSGFKHSEETKRKISENNRLHPHNVPRGSDCKKAILNEEQVASIKQLLVNGVSDKELGEMYNIGKDAISNIRLGQNWKQIPFPNGVSKIERGPSFERLSENEVMDIKSMMAQDPMLTDGEIAEKYEVSRHCISKIRIGSTWTEILPELNIARKYYVVLSTDQVKQIKEILEMGAQSDTDIAQQFNCSIPTITDIRNGKIWKNIPFSSGRKRLPKKRNSKKHTEESISQIKQLMVDGCSNKEIIDQFPSFTQPTLNDIRYQITWADVKPQLFFTSPKRTFLTENQIKEIIEFIN